MDDDAFFSQSRSHDTPRAFDMDNNSSNMFSFIAVSYLGSRTTEHWEEDSQTYCHLDVLCYVVGYSYLWKAREQLSVTESGKAIDCRSHNHVPIVAVTMHKRTLVNHAASGDFLSDWLLNNRRNTARDRSRGRQPRAGNKRTSDPSERVHRTTKKA